MIPVRAVSCSISKGENIMGECIFCLIAQGKIPSSKIYETNSLYAFLDLNPVHKGHTLIIPKKHAGNIFDLDPALGGELVSFMKKVGRAVMETTGATGLNIYQNNGRSAGQEVNHLHWHLIPRFDGDGLKLWPQGKYDSMEEMNGLAEKIRARLS